MCFFAATASGGSFVRLARHGGEARAVGVPPYLLVNLCGPKRTVAVATGAGAGRAAFAAAAAGASHDRVPLLRR